MRMSPGPAHRRPSVRRSVRPRVVLLVASLAIALFGGLLTQSSASATTATPTIKSQVVRITYNDPAFIAPNRCNGDLVNLHGEVTLTTVTTPTTGGFRVASFLSERNLTGTRIAPTPTGRYTGDNRVNSYSYIASPPYPTTYSGKQWIKLVPQFHAPTMWLVVVTREVILPDGTPISSVEQIYLTCSEPTSHDCHRES